VAAAANPEIGEEPRATLGALADVLIPAGEGMPSAGEVLIEREGIAAVLRVRPDLADGLRDLLVKARGVDPAAELARLQAEDEAGFQLLATVVSGGYFLDQGVRDALGYRGQEAIPIVPEDPPDYERDGLLTAVRERGAIYRPTPPE
jgi:hypothetical protein